MDKFPKLFIKAGLVYLGAGVLAGVLMALNIIDPSTFRFVHFHLNLVGFVGMVIFGVALHILPRFNGRPVPHPLWVPVQFYLMNAGLVGMVVFYLLGGYWESGGIAFCFGLSALALAASIYLFIFNVFPLLTDPVPAGLPATPADTSSKGAGNEKDKILGGMKVAMTLDTWPQTMPVFVEFGFKALANPIARAAFAKLITLSGACKIHHVDEEKFLRALNDLVQNSSEAPPPITEKPESLPAGAASQEIDLPPVSVTGKGITEGERCTGDVLVGKLIETYPQTKKVFEGHYGASCFSCPGQAFESIAQTASMHNADLDIILGEINAEIDKALSQS